MPEGSKVSYAKILEAVLGSVWAMEPGKLHSVASVLVARAGGVNVEVNSINAVVGDRDSREAAKEVLASSNGNGATASYQQVGSIAVVGIGGVIAKRASMVNQASTPKGTSIDATRASFRAARREYNAGNLGGVLLRIDSPGGTVDGVADMADEIFQARQAGMPVWAFADGQMASAAYYLGSQASRIVAAQDAAVGSIGTYMVVHDSSRAAENAGIKVHVLKSARLKGAGVEGAAIPPEALERGQRRIDQHNAAFLGAVSRGRGLTGQALEAVADGGVLVGREAVAARLVDAVGTVESVVSEMNRMFPARAANSGSVAASAAEGQAEMKTRGRASSVLAAAGAALAASGLGEVRGENGTPGDGPNGGGDFPAIDVHGLDAVYGADKGPNGQSATGPNSEGADKGPQGQSATGPNSAPAPAAPAAPAPALRLVNADEAIAAAFAANDERVAQIRAAARGFDHVGAVASVVNAAVANRNVTVEAARAQILDAVRGSSTPAGGVDLQVGASGWDRERAAHELVLISRLAPEAFDQLNGDKGARVAKVLGFDDARSALIAFAHAEANGLRRMRLIDLAGRCVHRHGRAKAFRSDTDVLADAYGHSSGDFPNLLAAGANKALTAYFSLQETTFRKWCAIGAAPDFKAQNLVTLSNLGGLKLTPEGGPVNQTTFGERKEAITLGTYTRGFGFTRQMLINDDLGGIQRLLQYWGVVCGILPEVLAWSVITGNAAMSDGYTLFGSEHSNLETSAALAQDKVELAVANMMKLKDFHPQTPDRNFITAKPKFLAVPVELWATAVRICNNATDSTLSSANSNVTNPLKGMLEPLFSPYLSAASAAAWYLIGDPSVMPLVQVQFLQGQQTPILTQVGTGSIMGQNFEVVFDCAAKSVQYEAGRKNAGG